MKKIWWFGVATLAMLVAAAATAHASGKYLWAQDSILVDQVKVRRIYDSQNGVHCYVASDDSYSEAKAATPVSISCVRAK